MQAKELKAYLLEDTNRICKLLEHFGFHDVWFGNEEIRCATPDGTNRTSVSVKLMEELYASSFSDEFNFRGDLFGLLQEASDTTFANVMIRTHNLFNLPHTGKEKKRLDLLKDVRKFKKGQQREIEIKKYDKSILNQFVRKPHASMIEEAIAPHTLERYDIMFDIHRDRIVFPYYDLDEPDKIVGIQERTTLSSELAKELNVPKYWNAISGFRKQYTLFGWHLAQEGIEKNKMIVLYESEKSAMKLDTIERGVGFGVALGGHELSEYQKSYILKNTSEDVEVVIAYDKDMMEEDIAAKDKGTPPQKGVGFLINECQRFSKFRKTSYIYDKYGILGEKDSPVDCGFKRWCFLLKHRIQVD